MLERNGRLSRLAEELGEAGLDLGGADRDLLIEEIDHALRPPVHERRVATSGTVVQPTTDPTAWEAGTALNITRVPTQAQPLAAARRYADGLSSWLLRHVDAPSEWLIFDRPAASERDLGVVAETMGATVIQRHPSGLVRVVGGELGVLRWHGYSWHHEPPLERWIEIVHAGETARDITLVRAFLQFAVHDLGAHGIGALLVFRESGATNASVEERLPPPPPLSIDRPMHLAPLRHALAQVDGAAVFDATGVLRQLGVQLNLSRDAEQAIQAYKGTRHTSGLRHSFDDPGSIVIAVSEDGPVSVFRQGQILGRSDTRR